MHVAGIVPVNGYKTDIELRYPSCLLPIKNNWTLVQQAVLECAMAGCNTIWIVANADMAPAIRHQVGERIEDPVYLYRTKNPEYFEGNRKDIPIYYVPIHPKDRDRRDSYGWSVLYGINSAWKVSFHISKWSEPQKYYISFPFGVMDHSEVRSYRDVVRDPNRNLFFTKDGKDVRSGLHLSFTMDPIDFKLCRRNVNSKTTKAFYPPLPNEKYPSKKLPLEDRWSARHFDFSVVFDKVETKNAVFVEPEWFHDVLKWDGYDAFMRSNDRPKRLFYLLTKSRRQAKIGVTTRMVIDENGDFDEQ